MLKRIKRIMVVLSMAFGLLAACGDDEDPQGPVPSNNQTVNNENNENNLNNVNNLNNMNNLNNVNNENNENNVNNTGECPELNPVLGACDPLCQTGCDDGQHCVARTSDPDDTELTATCGPEGAGSQGEECASDEDCAAGSMCISLDGAASECHRYCRPGSAVRPQCPSGLTCRPFDVELRVGVCEQAVDECSVFPDSCEDAQNCYDTPSGKRCAEYNAAAEPGDSCTESTECNERFRCVGDDPGDLSCRMICDPDDVDTCDAPTTCQRLNDADGNPLDWGACF